jgi:DNA-binding NarL/FixJ family response regulator
LQDWPEHLAHLCSARHVHQRRLEQAERLRASVNGRTRSNDVLGLTTREREVATLLADGLSNRDIATRLVVSEMTVEVHVKHILNKLGFRSRSQVAVWVAEHKQTRMSTSDS